MGGKPLVVDDDMLADVLGRPSIDVRCWGQTRRHLLKASFSAFDRCC
jgi:hypothetical protein